MPKKLADPQSDVWDLIFSYEAGGFYLASANVPGIEKATVQSCGDDGRCANRVGIDPVVVRSRL